MAEPQGEGAKMSFTGCLKRERLASVLFRLRNVSDITSITLQIDSVSQENARGELKRRFRGYH